MLLSVQARPADADKLEAILFRETPTLGVRRSTVTAHGARARSARTSKHLGDQSRAKSPILPDGSRRFTPEYEACHRIAAANGMSRWSK